MTTTQLMNENEFALIVEDSAVQAKKLKYFLDSANLNCRVVYSAEEALTVISTSRPSLIISDIVMPGMDGYELCSALKSHPGTKDIPVILLTSLNDPLDIIKGLQAGADNFITKPYDESYLLSRIQYLLINRNFRQSGGGEMFLEIVFRGKKYAINSEKKQILDLLLSVYEAAIQRNDELTLAKSQLEKANENLLMANEELDAFARTVSHDLRSPLSTIQGYLSVILGDEDKPLDPDFRKYLEIIEKSSANMASLIEDLLRFSRSGRSELVPAEVNLSKLASDIFETLFERNPDRSVQYHIQKDILVHADEALIGVVMENLLNNAWKYTSKRESAQISVGEIHSKTGEKTIFIKDNGAGFDISRADKLFQPFQRFHQNHEFNGTGVGLATVKRIIERHNGVIWADSSIGTGSIFYFKLPDIGNK